MATTKSKLPIGEQVKEALDGRTQRWLAREIGMTEDSLSRKMQGLLEFTDDEIESINVRLSSSIQK